MHNHEAVESFQNLVDCLERGLGVSVPEGFKQSFFFHIGKLNVSDYEDMTSLIILECQEALVAGSELDKEMLVRIVDRVRHRLSRARGRLQLIDPQREPAPPSVEPDVSLDILDEVLNALAAISPLHVTLFELRYVRHQQLNEISEALKMSRATVYRRLSEVRSAVSPLLSRRPH
ncbi:MAG: RNA polymerase sigma factor [Phycisphaerae bacterium]